MPAIKTTETDLIKEIITLGKPVKHASRQINKKHGILANYTVINAVLNNEISRCEECGEGYYANHKGQVFCDNECSSANRAATRELNARDQGIRRVVDKPTFQTAPLSMAWRK